jgi:hypothetical protein
MHLKILFSIRLWLAVGIIYLGLNFMIKQGDPLNLQLVFDRISEMNVSGKGNQTSDEAINRDLTFNYAYKRLAQRPWVVGDGYTTGEGYRKSLFGVESQSAAEVRDYHSLYLSLPIFFGWVGSFIFVLLVVLSLLFYVNNMFKVPRWSFAFYISLGFFLTWLMLFINEYKIQFLRDPNYFFLIWFWMAVSLNLSKKFSNEDDYLG